MSIRPEPDDVREEIFIFAAMMESRMAAHNNDRGLSWQETDPDQLVEGLMDHCDQLAGMAYELTAPNPVDYSEQVPNGEAILRKCADIANYAMMIADRYHTLDGD